MRKLAATLAALAVLAAPVRAADTYIAAQRGGVNTDAQSVVNASGGTVLRPTQTIGSPTTGTGSGVAEVKAAGVAPNASTDGALVVVMRPDSPAPANTAQETGGNLAAILAAVGSSVPPGGNVIGKVGIDQSTPGLSNLVAPAPTPGQGTQAVASAVGTTGAVTASLAGVSGHINYVCHIDVTSSGTTVNGLQPVTLTGLGSTLTFEYFAPQFGQGDLHRDFSPCLQAGAAGAAVSLNVPALGAGTAGVAAVITGYSY
jgi:hypothetical protein